MLLRPLGEDFVLRGTCYTANTNEQRVAEQIRPEAYDRICSVIKARQAGHAGVNFLQTLVEGYVRVRTSLT